MGIILLASMTVLVGGTKAYTCVQSMEGVFNNFTIIQPKKHKGPKCLGTSSMPRMGVAYTTATRQRMAYLVHTRSYVSMDIQWLK